MMPGEMVTQSDIDAIVVEAGDNVKDDAELCLHLRQHFDARLMLIASNVSEDFAVAAYLARVDECIVGPISTNLLSEKINAHVRLKNRETPKVEYSAFGVNRYAH